VTRILSLNLSTNQSAWQKIRLRQLKLLSYRNYRQLQLDFDGCHVVLSGHNGAGKTNILEAISLLSPGRGLRRATYGEMKNLNQVPQDCIKGQNAPSPPLEAEFVVHARLTSPDYGTAEIGTGSMATASGQTTRRLRINGANVAAEDLLDYCRIIWLVPAMDGLFTGSASDRRRFVDRMVLSTHPLHGRLVTDYEKLMRSRHKLLVDGRLDTRWLTTLEGQMAEIGVAIAAARLEMVAHLQAMIDNGDPHSVFPRADLALVGTLEQELAKKRVNGRVSEGGHNIEPEVIERRYKNGIKNLFDVYLPIVDNCYIFDNSENTRELIARKNFDNFAILRADRFDLLKGAIS